MAKSKQTEQVSSPSPNPSPSTRPLFLKYHVTLCFTTRFAAGIPANPDTLLDFLKARAPARPPENAVPLDILAQQVAEELPPLTEPEQAMTTTFKRAPSGYLVYEARCIKSHLKECASILNKFEDATALKSRLANRVQVEPAYLPLYREASNDVFTEPSGQEVRPITVVTRQGPRTAIKVVEYVENPRLEFDLVILNDSQVSEQLLRDVLEYGGRIKGMGQDRGMGLGRYAVRDFQRLGD